MFAFIGSLALPFVCLGDTTEAPVFADTTPAGALRGFNAHESAAVAVLSKYRDAHNVGSAAEAIKLYASDAVLVEPYRLDTRASGFRRRHEDGRRR